MSEPDFDFGEYSPQPVEAAPVQVDPPAPAPLPFQAEGGDDDAPEAEASNAPPLTSYAPPFTDLYFCLALAASILGVYFLRQNLGEAIYMKYGPLAVGGAAISAALPLLALIPIRPSHPRSRIYFALSAISILILSSLYIFDFFWMLKFSAAAAYYSFLDFFSNQYSLDLTGMLASLLSNSGITHVSAPVILDLLKGLGAAVGLCVVAALSLAAAAAHDPTTAEKDEDGKRRALSSPESQAYWMPRPMMARKFRDKFGLILGQISESKNSQLLVHEIEGHGIITAPTRSGKGLWIIFQLLSMKWAGSIWLFDPTGEGFRVASQARSMAGRKQILIDPLGVVVGAKSINLNPLHPRICRRPPDPASVGDVQALVDCLLPALAGKSSAGSGSEFFNQSGRDLIKSMIIWVLSVYPPESRNLYSVQRLLSLPPLPLDEAGELQIEGVNPPSDPLFPATLGELFLMILKNPSIGFGIPAKEIGGIMRIKGRADIIKTALNSLSWLDDPRMRDHTSASSIHPDSLMNQNSDVHVIIPPEAFEFCRGWTRIVASLPAFLARTKPPPARVLVMLDEAAQFGYLSVVPLAFRLAAKFGVSYFLFAQDHYSMIDLYGVNGWKSLCSNAELNLVVGVSSADSEFAKSLSQSIGTATYLDETHKSTSRKAGLESLANANISKSEQTKTVPLISPSQIQNLEFGKMILLMKLKAGRNYPIRLFLPKYFERSETKKLAQKNTVRQK